MKEITRIGVRINFELASKAIAPPAFASFDIKHKIPESLKLLRKLLIAPSNPLTTLLKKKLKYHNIVNQFYCDTHSGSCVNLYWPFPC